MSKLKKLTEVFKNCDENTANLAAGLIERAEFLETTLKNLEDDISKNGYYEKIYKPTMIDGPVEQERSSVKIYNSTVKNYNSIILTLSKLAQKCESGNSSDSLMSFLGGGSK